MLYSTLHKRWPRLVASVVGELIAAAALNLFIVPLGLYTGGMLGLCQLIRTVLFSPQVAIYSVIYNFFTAMVLDRVHQQNINVQALIFTREDQNELAHFIISSLGRSVTYWNGTGAYTGENIHVLCVCLSKYEIEELLRAVHTIDPHAFLTVQEGTHIYGNFTRKLE